MTKPNLNQLFAHVSEDLRISLETNSYPEAFHQDPHAYIAIGQIWNHVCLNLLQTARNHPEYKNLSVELRHLVEEELAEAESSESTKHRLRLRFCVPIVASMTGVIISLFV